MEEIAGNSGKWMEMDKNDDDDARVSNMNPYHSFDCVLLENTHSFIHLTNIDIFSSHVCI